MPNATLDLRYTIASSIINTQYDYLEMTGKRGFRDVEKSIPEKMLEVFAAKDCFNALHGQSYHVFQEFSFSNINKNIKQVHFDKRAKKFEKSTKRLDIAITNSQQHLHAIVEIKRKNALSHTYKKRDIDRLREIKKYYYDRTGVSIKAYFAYAFSNNFKDDEQFMENKSSIKSAAADLFGKNHKISIDKHRKQSIEGEKLYFCFGAVCGSV